MFHKIKLPNYINYFELNNLFNSLENNLLFIKDNEKDIFDKTKISTNGIKDMFFILNNKLSLMNNNIMKVSHVKTFNDKIPDVTGIIKYMKEKFLYKNNIFTEKINVNYFYKNTNLINLDKIKTECFSKDSNVSLEYIDFLNVDIKDNSLVSLELMSQYIFFKNKYYDLYLKYNIENIDSIYLSGKTIYPSNKYSIRTEYSVHTLGTVTEYTVLKKNIKSLFIKKCDSPSPLNIKEFNGLSNEYISLTKKEINYIKTFSINNNSNRCITIQEVEELIRKKINSFSNLNITNIDSLIDFLQNNCFYGYLKKDMFFDNNICFVDSKKNSMDSIINHTTLMELLKTKGKYNDYELIFDENMYFLDYDSEKKQKIIDVAHSVGIELDFTYYTFGKTFSDLCNLIKKISIFDIETVNELLNINTSISYKRPFIITKIDFVVKYYNFNYFSFSTPVYIKLESNFFVDKNYIFIKNLNTEHFVFFKPSYLKLNKYFFLHKSKLNVKHYTNVRNAFFSTPVFSPLNNAINNSVVIKNTVIKSKNPISFTFDDIKKFVKDNYKNKYVIYKDMAIKTEYFVLNNIIEYLKETKAYTFSDIDISLYINSCGDEKVTIKTDGNKTNVLKLGLKSFTLDCTGAIKAPSIKIDPFLEEEFIDELEEVPEIPTDLLELIKELKELKELDELKKIEDKNPDIIDDLFKTLNNLKLSPINDDNVVPVNDNLFYISPKRYGINPDEIAFLPKNYLVKDVNKLYKKKVTNIDAIAKMCKYIDSFILIDNNVVHLFSCSNSSFSTEIYDEKNNLIKTGDVKFLLQKNMEIKFKQLDKVKNINLRKAYNVVNPIIPFPINEDEFDFDMPLNINQKPKCPPLGIYQKANPAAYNEKAPSTNTSYYIPKNETIEKYKDLFEANNKRIEEIINFETLNAEGFIFLSEEKCGEVLNIVTKDGKYDTKNGYIIIGSSKLKNEGWCNIINYKMIDIEKTVCDKIVFLHPLIGVNNISQESKCPPLGVYQKANPAAYNEDISPTNTSYYIPKNETIEKYKNLFETNNKRIEEIVDFNVLDAEGFIFLSEEESGEALNIVTKDGNHDEKDGYIIIGSSKLKNKGWSNIIDYKLIDVEKTICDKIAFLNPLIGVKDLFNLPPVPFPGFKIKITNIISISQQLFEKILNDISQDQYIVNDIKYQIKIGNEILSDFLEQIFNLTNIKDIDIKISEIEPSMTINKILQNFAPDLYYQLFPKIQLRFNQLLNNNKKDVFFGKVKYPDRDLNDSASSDSSANCIDKDPGCEPSGEIEVNISDGSYSSVQKDDSIYYDYYPNNSLEVLRENKNEMSNIDYIKNTPTISEDSSIPAIFSSNTINHINVELILKKGREEEIKNCKFVLESPVCCGGVSGLVNGSNEDILSVYSNQDDIEANLNSFDTKKKYFEKAESKVTSINSNKITIQNIDKETKETILDIASNYYSDAKVSINNITVDKVLLKDPKIIYKSKTIDHKKPIKIKHLGENVVTLVYNESSSSIFVNPHSITDSGLPIKLN